VRITSTTNYITMRQGLESTLSSVADAQNQLSTGKKILRYSDSPSDAVTALRYSSQESDWAAYKHSADDASRWLNTADGTLQSVSTTLQKVRTLAVNGINGSLGQSSRDALAQEVDALRDHLVDLANTKIGSRGLFSGFGDTAVAKDSTGWTYQGDQGQVNRQIGPSMKVQVNLPGDTVFGFDAGAGNDVFSTLDKLSADLRSGNVAGMQADQTTLDDRFTGVTRALGTLGALEKRVDDQLTLGSDSVDEIKRQRSELSDVDIAEAALKLQQAQTGYQAALSAASRSNLPSLADFLH
jgi:flagellar hook-associated protein 3 FlgL